MARRQAPAATACAASPRWSVRETGKAAMNFETAAGVIACRRTAEGLFTVDMGVPRFALGRDSAGEADARHARDRPAIGPAGAPILRSPSAVNMGNPHAIFWVDDVERYDLRRIGPVLEHHPLFPERANITLAAVACARPYRDPHLGARRRPHQGLRLGGLRRRRRRRAALHAPAARSRSRCRAAILPIEWRESGRPCADDRAGRIRASTAASMRRCSPPPARLR